MAKERKVSKEKGKTKAKLKEKGKTKVNHMGANPHQGDRGNQKVIHGQEKGTHFMIIQQNNPQGEAEAVNHQTMTIG